MKPICHPCQRFYRPERNGFSFVEGMPIHNDSPPGTEAPDQWRPYKLWVGDLWRCHGCGHQIVVGVAAGPIAEKHEPDFEDKVRQRGADYVVNDC